MNTLSLKKDRLPSIHLYVSSLRIILWSIRLYPLAWLLGLAGIFPLAAGFVAFCVHLASQMPKRIGAVVSSFFLYLCLFAFALAYGSTSADAERSIASLYNLSIWITGLYILFVVKNSVASSQLLFQIIVATRNLGVITSILCLGVLVLWTSGVSRIEFPSLLGVLLPNGLLNKLPLLLTTSLKPILLETDFFMGSSVPRIRVFHPYPNALALSATFALILHFYLERFQKHNPWLFTNAIIIALLLIPLIFSWSRFTILFLLLMIPLAWILSHKSHLFKIICCLLLIIILICSSLIGAKLALSTWNTFSTARQGSTSTRLLLYQETFKFIVKRPLLGYGVKPLDPESIALPIGSHSSYLGILLRVGILGMIPFAFYLLLILKKSFQSFHTPLGAALAVTVFVTLGWMLVEDLDAPAFVAFQHFYLLGIMLSINHMEVS